MLNNNSFTINLNDDITAELLKVAQLTQRKPAELLRLLVTPAIIKAYAEIQKDIHPGNNALWSKAIFKN